MHSTPRAARRLVAGLLAVASLAAVATGQASAAAPTTSPSSVAKTPTTTNAYYSPTTTAPQSKSLSAFRSFLSSEQTRFDLQSYPFFGSLVDDRGRTNTFSLMMQQNNQVDGLPLSYALEGVMFNQGTGFTAGGVQGIPQYTLPLTVTAHPWSIRAQAFSIGSSPQFVDARVVSGHIGQKGAVYELTSSVTAGRLDGTNKPYLLQVYVRVKDTLGMAQWGYGPSGFFPQWIYPAQRAAIVRKYHGNVGAYLAATHDRMSGQGDYYYSAPLLQVQEYALYANGRQFSHGRRGWLWLDNVEQSFDAAADKIVQNKVTWTEFSTQLPGAGTALKIGWVNQKSVGTLSYAMLAAGRNGRFVDGNLATSSWDVPSITISAVPGSRYTWRSKATGLVYHTRYRVLLRKAGNAKGHSAALILSAVYGDQEVAFKGGRAVYEGLYTVTGWLDGKRVSGQAWGEVQPAGTL
jgi:hypothetical protein